MKFCQAHWDALRSAVGARGLDPLVAKSGEEAHARMVGEIEDGASKGTFDPLLGAHWAIINNALRLGGLSIMACNDDGSDRCPLCFLKQVETEKVAEYGRDAVKVRIDTWIDDAADGAKEEAIRLGLVGTS